MKTTKKILTSICILAYSLGFSQNSTSIDNSINIINLEQKEIPDIQNNTNLIDSTSSGVANRENINGAINSLERAITDTEEGSSQRLQVQLSLFVLEVGEGYKTKSKQTLQNLVKKFPNAHMVQIYRTSYANVLGFNDYNKSLDKLKKSTWAKMPHYIKAMEVIDKSYNLHIDTSANKIHIYNKENPIIVALGFILHSDGSMDNVLIDRLKTTLSAYKEYPDATIIVSGGAKQAGVTEAYRMKQWLIAHDVPENKITFEALSISTVWNSLNTVNIINNSQQTVKDMILVTSDSHIKRANSIFAQAFANKCMDIKIYNLASKTKIYNLSAPTSNDEKALIIKDTLRTAGVWQIPGMVL